MFGRSKKAESEQGGEGRRVQRQGGLGPAFSYYNNRPAPVPEEARSRRQERFTQQETGKSRAVPRLRPSAWSFWLLLAVAVVCLVKILFLSTDPKIVIVGDQSAATYARTAETYQTAAHKLLSGSILNHTKLSVNLGGVTQALQREFPELQTVSMNIPLVSNRPIVYVQVAQPSLVVEAAGGGSYALNTSGVVLAQLRNLPAGVPVAADQSGMRPRPGKQLLPGSTVSFARMVAYQFSAAKLPISTFVLPADAPYELDARLSGQTYLIRMNLEADARTQSGVAIATIRQLGSAVPGQYLDVRTPGRAYYK